MNRNVVHVDNLSNQKVSPALALLDRKLTTALEHERGEKASGTCKFLKIVNDHATQLLLTVSMSKVLKAKEATVFSSTVCTRLKCFHKISSWLTDD